VIKIAPFLIPEVYNMLSLEDDAAKEKAASKFNSETVPNFVRKAEDLLQRRGGKFINGKTVRRVRFGLGMC
jgi:hypothetical protein